MSDFIHLNPIVQQINGAGAEITTNLFSHEFYYLQNNQTDEDLRDYCKALLFLHTLPVDYANMNYVFNKSEYQVTPKPKRVGYTDVTSYWYLLLLGSMVWRRNYMKSHNNAEPLRLSAGRNTYVSPGVDYVWVNGVNLFCTQYQTQKYFKYSDFIDENANPYFEKKVLDMFLNFVDDKFKIVKMCCEFAVSQPNEYMPRTQHLINYDIFRRIFTALYIASNTNNYLQQYEILSGKRAIELSINNETNNYIINGFDGHYVMGFMETSAWRCIRTYYSENSPVQEIFKEYFFTPCLVSSIPTMVNSNGISKSTLQQYYKGYADAIVQCYEKQEESTSQTDALKLARQMSQDERDLKCELYLTIKNIWDRWLCGYYYQKDGVGREFFKVQNFFRNNFIFIDSFYTNIYDTLKLNCNYLRDNFVGDKSNTTRLGKKVVTHLGDVAAHHRSMMFNFPDSINFSGLDKNGNINEDDMYSHLAEMFLPVPANEVTEPVYSNKFTIIYTHSANKLDTNDRNKFVPDSFDIWSYNEGTEVAPRIFHTQVKSPTQTGMNQFYPEARIAYKVPAFGVAYSQQNNSLWQKIDVRMDNFSITEQTVKAMAVVAEMGSSEKKNICFYGQDLYSIYQSYSYLVTIEMMGNAQIQPLMYFQLMNIPMFRGTYMIISVEHSLTPGNMVTRFTGMKMSKVQVPYTESWFTYPKEEDYETIVNDESSDNEEVLTSAEGDRIDLADNNLSRIIATHNGQTMDCDVFVKTVYNELFSNAVVPEARINDENNGVFTYFTNDSDWNVVKLTPSGMKSNNWKSLYKENKYPKVGDILFGYNNHHSDGLHTHMAIYLGVHGNNKYVVEGMSVPNGSDVVNYTNAVQIVRFENSRLSGSDDLMTHFVHYLPENMQQVEYTRVSTNPNSGQTVSSSSASESSGDKIMPQDHGALQQMDYNRYPYRDNAIWMMYRLINEPFNVRGRSIRLTQLQAAAIVGCFCRESGWNPDAKNPTSAAYGIPQWLGARKTTKYQQFLRDMGQHPSPNTNIEDTHTVEDQFPYILWEFGKDDRKTYYAGTCKLWGADPNGTVRFGNNVNLCGNLMAWANVNRYDEEALCNMVYRFMVAYENGNAPYHHQEFVYNTRCSMAKMAYDLYEDYRTGRYIPRKQIT